MAYDWFVVPLVMGGLANNTIYPKYHDQVDGFSGSWQHFDAQTYAALPWAGEDRYVVRFYADDSVLDSIYNNNDAYALYRDPSVDEQDVVNYLNDIHDTDHTFEEWENSFSQG